MLESQRVNFARQNDVRVKMASEAKCFTCTPGSLDNVFELLRVILLCDELTFLSPETQVGGVLGTKQMVRWSRDSSASGWYTVLDLPVQAC